MVVVALAESAEYFTPEPVDRHHVQAVPELAEAREILAGHALADLHLERHR